MKSKTPINNFRDQNAGINLELLTKDAFSVYAKIDKPFYPFYTARFLNLQKSAHEITIELQFLLSKPISKLELNSHCSFFQDDKELPKFDIIIGILPFQGHINKIEVLKSLGSFLNPIGAIVIGEEFILPYKTPEQKRASSIEYHQHNLSKFELEYNSKELVDQEYKLLAQQLIDQDSGKISLDELDQIAQQTGMMVVRRKKISSLEDDQPRGQFVVVVVKKNNAANNIFAISQIKNEQQEAIDRETSFQRNTINLIAPTNISPEQVKNQLNGPFINVVAEGYRNDRFHTGTKNYDDLERSGEQAARILFGAEYVNLKPHSGTQAVQASLLALRQEKLEQLAKNNLPLRAIRLLSLSLKAGGHITHLGVTEFNKAMGFEVSRYSVSPNGDLNYKEIEKIALEKKPDIIIAGASALPKAMDFKRFREIADRVDARLVADVAHYFGLIAGNAYPNPVPFADIVTSSTSKTLPGGKGGIILMKEYDSDLTLRVTKAVNIGMQSEDLAGSLAAKTVMLTLALEPHYKIYAKQVVVNSQKLAEHLNRLGIPVVGYDKKTKGTQSHLVLINVAAFKPGLTGHIAAKALERIGILSNKNNIPNDPLNSFNTSGVRFGTATITHMGMTGQQMKKLASLIYQSLNLVQFQDGIIYYDYATEQILKSSVKKLAHQFNQPIL